MKIVFCCYSLEGNTHALARAMAGAVGGEVLQIVLEVDDMPRHGVLKYLVGGKRALFKETPAIKPLPASFAEADLVVVGGPVWFGRMAPPVRTFLQTANWFGKKAAVFAMHRGGKGKAASSMAALVRTSGGGVVGEGNFIDLRYRKAEKTLESAVKWITAAVETAGA